MSVAPAPDSWRAIQRGPLTARWGAQAVWSDEEMLVVGGQASLPCPANAQCVSSPRLIDGAAYIPEHDSWRRIADAPVPPSGDAIPVWTGDELFVLASRTVEGSVGPGESGEYTLLSYRPATDRWVEVEARPQRLSPFALWTGEEILFWSMNSMAGEDWLYDPATGRWRQLPADPLGPTLFRSFVHVEDSLVLLAQEPSGTAPIATRAARYALAAEQWERLSDSEAVACCTWFPAGDVIVNPQPGFQDRADGTFPGNPYGGVYDPERGEWSALAQPARHLAVDSNVEAPPVVWGGLGDWVLLPNSRAIYAPASGTWHVLPDRAHLGSSGSAVWTGNELIVWGGIRTNARGAPVLTATGAAYTPPPP